MSNKEISTVRDQATGDTLDRFPSFSSLRAAHVELLQRRRGNGSTPEFLERAAAFVRRGQATGAVLDGEEDRRASQSLLDYWSNWLYREGLPPPDATLVDFDPSLLPDIDDDLCPYRGLDAFDEDHSEAFRGRQRLVDEMVQRLRAERLLALVGLSGSGKSSAVLAGLLPALRAGALPGSKDWRYCPPMVPGSKPLQSLARALRPPGDDGSEWDARQAGRLRANPHHLARLASESDTPIVLVVDQFEELFTLCLDEEERQAFADNVLNLARAERSRHTVVLTMRSDFESYVTSLPDFYDSFQASVVHVTPLSARELRQAIQEPAEMVGLKYEQGVVDALVSEVLGEPAALPLLQFSLLKLWEHRERNRITLASYRRRGGGRTALERSAEEFYEGLLGEDQTTVKRILLRLVRPDEDRPHRFTSGRVRREDLYGVGDTREQVDRVLDRLIEERLVRLTEGEAPGDAQVEVAHEALVRNWRRLVNWLEEERESIRQRLVLTAAAQRWAARGRDSSVLLRGRLLDEAQRQEDLNDLEAEFVQASQDAWESELDQAQKAAKKERKLSRRLAWSVVGLATTLVLAIVFATLGWVTRAWALRETRSATSRWLVTQAQIQDDPVRGLLLAVEALNVREPSDPPAASAEEVLREGLAHFGARSLRGDTSARVVAISENDHWLVTGSDDGSVRLWDLAAGAPAGASTVLTGHQAVIVALAIDPDERWAATGDARGEMRLWDLTAEDPAAAPIVLTDHQSKIKAIAFSPDGNLMATGDAAGQVRLWDLSAPGQTFTPGVLEGHADEIGAIAFGSDGQWLVTGGYDGQVRLWDLTTTSPPAAPKVLTGHQGAIVALAIAPQGGWVATGDTLGEVRLWYPSAYGREPFSFVIESRERAIKAVAYSPDGRWLVTGGEDGNAHRWALDDAGLPSALTVLAGHDGPITALAISADSRCLVTGGGDATVRTWDLTAENPAETSVILRGPLNSVAVLALGGSCRWLAAASGEETVRLWDLDAPDRGPTPAILQGHEGSVGAVAFGSDGRWLSTSDQKGVVRLWDLAAGAPGTTPAVLTDSEGADVVLAVSPDGRWMATAGKDSVVRLWDLAGDAPTEALDLATGSDHRVSVLAFGPASRRLAAGSDDGIAWVWDTSNLAHPTSLRGHKGAIRALAFSPDGSWLATGGQDGDVRLRNLTASDLISERILLHVPEDVDAVTGKAEDQNESQEKDEDAGPRPISALVFSPDGRWLAIVRTRDKTVGLWGWNDLGTPVPMPDLSGHKEAITDVAFSPNGRWLVTSSEDKTVRLWTVHQRVAEIATREDHDSWVTHVALSPDSKQLFTGSADGTVRRWDLTEKGPAESAVTLRGHKGAITALAVDPEGRWAASGSSDGTARLWMLSQEELVDLACSTAGRSLTLDEQRSFDLENAEQRACGD